MLGLFLTLLAGLAVICFAFCYSDSRAFKADGLFYLTPKRLKKNPESKDLEDLRNLD